MAKKEGLSVVVTKKDLLRLLGRVQSVVERRGTMPVLSHVLLDAQGESLRVIATDLRISVTAKASAEVGHAGAILLPAKELLDRIKVMPEGPIQIADIDGATAGIKAVGMRREFKLRAMDAENFPAVAKCPAQGDAIELPAAALGDLFDRVEFSISIDETRPHLNSALLELNDNMLRVVSTDGHRLTKAEATVEGVKQGKSMLLSRKSVTEVVRLCEEGAGDSKVRVAHQNGHAFFVAGETTLGVTLVDAAFPPYEQVIPKATESTARVSRDALVDALRAMSVSANERTGSVHATFTKGALRLKSEDPDSGSASDEIPAEFDGADRTVGLNGRYVTDVLGVLKSDDIKIGISGELDPLVLEPTDDTSTLAIVMPMRI